MPGGGLEGVVAADSAVSKVEGDIGRLTYRGYNVLDLVRECGFEEAAYLLWTGRPQGAGLRLWTMSV